MAIVKLLRPKHWIKNFFVMAPLIFSGEFLHYQSIKQSIYAFIIFSMASSVVYIFNDINDIDLDRQHHSKSNSRPLAAGKVSLKDARILLLGLFLILILVCLIFTKIIPAIVAYLLINLAYTYALKRQPVIDIFSIAAGFVLRVYAGALAIDVPLSSWMFVTTLCLALYLAAIKRRQELVQNGINSRPSLEKYSVQLMDRYAEMSATGALLFYSLYVMSSKQALIITIPFVLFGIFRYWYIVDTVNGGESPTEALYNDWQLIISIVLWVILCGIILLPTQI